MLHFFFISIIDEIPLETAEIILLFLKIIIEGKHFSANNTLIIFKIMYKLLNHPLTNLIVGRFLVYDFPSFFIHILETNLQLNSFNDEILKLLNECLNCSTLLFQKIKCEDFIPFINHSIQCFPENSLKTGSLNLINTLIETNKEAMIYLQENLWDFLVNLNENFITFTYNEKELISELILFTILHIEDQNLINFMIDHHFFFPFICLLAKKSLI